MRPVGGSPPAAGLAGKQLKFAASDALVPSFFPIHRQAWGDRHSDIFLGPWRAARIDPARSALDRGMKIKPYEALRAATNHAAWQNFEDLR